MTTGEYKCKRPHTWFEQQQTDMEQWSSNMLTTSQWRVPEAGKEGAPTKRCLCSRLDPTSVVLQIAFIMHAINDTPTFAPTYSFTW